MSSRIQVPWIGFDPYYHQYFGMALKEEGVNTVTYPTVSEGLEDIRTNHYRLVIVQDTPSNPGDFKVEGRRLFDLGQKVALEVRATRGYESKPIVLFCNSDTDFKDEQLPELDADGNFHLIDTTFNNSYKTSEIIKRILQNRQ